MNLPCWYEQPFRQLRRCSSFSTGRINCCGTLEVKQQIPSPWKGEGQDGGSSYERSPSGNCSCIALTSAIHGGRPPSPFQGEGAKP